MIVQDRAYISPSRVKLNLHLSSLGNRLAPVLAVDLAGSLGHDLWTATQQAGRGANRETVSAVDHLQRVWTQQREVLYLATVLDTGNPDEAQDRWNHVLYQIAREADELRGLGPPKCSRSRAPDGSPSGQVSLEVRRILPRFGPATGPARLAAYYAAARSGVRREGLMAACAFFGQ